METQPNVEQFAVSMCEYIFIKLGVVKINFCEKPESDELFTEAIGKTVLYHRMLMRDCLKCFFTCNFNRIVADAVSIAYEFCSRIYTFSSGIAFHDNFFRLSACVVELFLYCRESCIEEVQLSGAPRVWRTVFDLVLKSELHRQGGWDNITMHANICSDKLSPYFEPLIKHVRNPYDDLPDIGDLPSEFACINSELKATLEKAYSVSTLRYLPTIPPPLFLRKVDAEEVMDDDDSGNISPPKKRFKRVHQVFDYS